jgi:hypothetical protein
MDSYLPAIVRPRKEPIWAGKGTSTITIRSSQIRSFWCQGILACR